MSIEIEAGKYHAQPRCWGFGQTPKGHQQFMIEFAVTRGEGDEIRMTKFIGLADERGEKILADTLRTCGWDGADFGAIELGKDLTVEVVIELDGDYGMKIKYVNAIDGAGGGLVSKFAMPEDEKAKMIARLNARMKGAGPATTRSAAPTRGPAPASAGQPPPRTTPAPRTPPPPKRQAVAQPAPSDWGMGEPPDAPGGEDSIPF